MLSEYQTLLLLVALVLLQTRRTCSSWASSALACTVGQGQSAADARYRLIAAPLIISCLDLSAQRLVCVCVCVCDWWGLLLTSFMLWPSTTRPMGWCLGNWGLEDERTTPPASLSLGDTECVVHFIKQYAVSFPGFKRDDIRVQRVKCYVFMKQVPTPQDTASWLHQRHVKKLWMELCLFIVVARPVTDLCWRCQQNNTDIYRSADLTLEEKGELLQEHAVHLSQVDAGRHFYKR